jgi:hypothetical protein
MAFFFTSIISRPCAQPNSAPDRGTGVNQDPIYRCDHRTGRCSLYLQQGGPHGAIMVSSVSSDGDGFYARCSRLQSSALTGRR